MSNDSSHLDIGDKTAFFNEDVHVYGKLYVHSIESLDDETTYGISGGGGSTHDHATEHLNLGNLTVTGLTVNGNATIVGDTTATDINATGIAAPARKFKNESIKICILISDNEIIIPKITPSINGFFNREVIRNNIYLKIYNELRFR